MVAQGRHSRVIHCNDNGCLAAVAALLYDHRRQRLSMCSLLLPVCLKVMKEFPEEIQGDICVHLNKDVLSLSLFDDASQGCLKVRYQAAAAVASARQPAVSARQSADIRYTQLTPPYASCMVYP